MKPTPKITCRADLEFRSGGSDKVYHIWIENVGANHTVKFKYGRRGATLNEGTKIGPTHEAEAQKVYRSIVTEKLGKGYEAMPSSRKIIKPTTTIIATETAKAVAKLAKTLKETTSVQLLNPIDRGQLDTYLEDTRYVMQEKKDGRRMVLSRKNGVLQAYNRTGKEVAIPLEYADVISEAFVGIDFIIDGEACGEFFFAFDIMALQTNRCVESDYADRLLNLSMLLRSSAKQHVIKQVDSFYTTKDKRKMLDVARHARWEGVVFKDLSAKYTVGRPNSLGPQFKYKFIASCTCGVKNNEKGKRSVGLVMISDKDYRHPVDVGNVTIPVNHEMPVPGEVVEVEYLYAYPGGSLYQPVYKGKRDDVEIDSIETLKLKQEVA